MNMQIAKNALYVLLLIFLIDTAQAANVALYPSNITVSQGETFSLNISIDPLGTAISGAQLNLIFNKSILNINSITEGNLFRQNGANTFFKSGVINNSSGTVKNIFCVIIGPNNISTSGTFVIVDFTAIGQSGATGIDLSNVIISNPGGKAVSFNIGNESININATSSILPAMSEDLNGDNAIDILDLIIVAQHFGEVTSAPYPKYDINNDGIVDIIDIVRVAGKIS